MPEAPPVHRPQGWRSDAQRKAESDARRRRDPAYLARRRLYNSKAWKQARGVKLAQNPLCEPCKAAGRLVPAVHVDHDKPLAAGGEAVDAANLVSMCHSCHSRKTAQRDGGYGRATP